MRLQSAMAGAVAAALAVAAVSAVAPVRAQAASSTFTVPPGVNLTGVVCADAANCTGVGINGEFSGFFTSLDSGVVSGETAVPNVSRITGLTCPIASTCYAVGQASNGGAVVSDVYGVIQAPVVVSGVTTLNGIACDPGTTTCVAVGTLNLSTTTAPFSEGVVVDLSNGTPTGPAQAVSSFSALGAVVCPVAEQCLGVGPFNGSTTSLGGVVPIDGGVPGTPVSIANTYNLTAIVCESATTCWAGGASPSGHYVIEISSGTPGSPVAENTVSSFTGGTCPSASTCYLSGTTGQDGAVLPVVGDVPQALEDIASMRSTQTLACLSTTQCVAAGSVGQPFQSYTAAFVTDVPPSPPPSISAVSFSGTGTSLTLTVTGANLGAWAPEATPQVPLSCVKGDRSFDYAAGVLAFTDTTEGWSAGTPGSCIGLVVKSWSDTQAVLGFGLGYVYPKVLNGDAYSVTIDGSTATGTAAVTNPALPSIGSVAFGLTGASPVVTLTGSNFGTRVPLPNPSNPDNCTAGDTSHNFGPGALGFADTTRSWTAGESGDCLGLTVSTWTNTKVVLGFGAFYPFVSALQTGDAYTVTILGRVCSGLAGSGTCGAHVSGVTFSQLGTQSATVTVTGTKFGTEPSNHTTVGCISGDTSVTFPAGELQFTDSTRGWTAGENGDCIGVTVVSWSASKVVFQFGAYLYQTGFFTPVTSGDAYQVIVQGSAFTGTVP